MENGWGGPQLAVATPGTLVELAALLPAASRGWCDRGASGYRKAAAPELTVSKPRTSRLW
jgi:hypothetical protein